MYIKLPPKLKGGQQLPKADAEKHLANHHTKVEFLDLHLQQRGHRLDPPIETVIWCHQVRSEMYH
ncbi:MAG: hypothetical protein GX446_00765 [Chthonomonadales bacterium]|nr:hypothetical protein [Chthonomonadales bacterium]